MPQEEVIAFLSDPANHGGITPKRIETHGAFVFLLPECVYKMKRAVEYPFMDFSTREKRHTACLAEVSLNRRTAPDLYLGTKSIIPDGEGLTLGALNQVAPEAVETVVVMRRFGNTLAEEQASNSELTELAETLAAFHASEPSLENPGGAAAVRDVLEGNLKFLSERPNGDRALVAELHALALAAFDTVTPQLEARAAGGSEKYCHGDLHLNNICRWQGHPVPFDCIEFNPAFAETDTLYDLAFLLMDLDEHAQRAGANLVLNRYLEICPGEVSALGLLPLYLSMRAQVRGKVAFATAALQGGQMAEDRRQEGVYHLQRAIEYLTPAAPLLLAVGGPSGSGKSTLSKALAPLIGAVPGAVIARSDAIRKRRYGSGGLTDPLPKTAYSPKASHATYREMEEICAAALSAGQAAIADATFTHAGSRKTIAVLGEKSGVPFHGIWLDLDQETARQRVTDRRGDVSDADAAVVDLQFEQGWGAMTWHRIDARAPLAEQVNSVLQKIGQI